MSRRGRKDSGPRSDDERRRARLEREQRRAQREGRAVPSDIEDLPVVEPTLLVDAVGPDYPHADASHPATPDPTLSPGVDSTPDPDPDPDPDRTLSPGVDPLGDPTPAREATAGAPPAVVPPEAAPWWSASAPAGPTVDVGDALAAPGAPTPAPSAPATPPSTPARFATPSVAVDDPTLPSASAAASPGATVVREPLREAPDHGFPTHDDHDDFDDHHDEPPLAPLRPTAPSVGSVPPSTVQARTAPSRRGVSRIAAVLVLVPLVLLAVAAVLFFQPFKGEGGEAVRVQISPGTSVDEIGKLLAEKGVIDNALLFSIRARVSGGGGDLRAGTVELRKNMSYADALTVLRNDPLPPPVIRVGIPEGLSRRETAAHVKQAGISGSYLTASARSPGFDPRRYGQPKRQSGLEGFLFPATYELPRGGATAKALVAEQLKMFEKQIATVSMKRARKAHLSTYEVLIIASMIEREVRIPSERKLVAAVIYNRLKTDMTLGIDATIRYAERNWTRPLKVSELQRDGPYNTRLRTGLPPTPIGNPGLASIQAAAAPANKPYLYYVVRPCGNGKHAFSSTDAQFARDQQAYATAQKRAGGDPSVCSKSE